jgi:hypothetical protein
MNKIRQADSKERAKRDLLSQSLGAIFRLNDIINTAKMQN